MLSSFLVIHHINRLLTTILKQDLKIQQIVFELMLGSQISSFIQNLELRIQLKDIL